VERRLRIPAALEDLEVHDDADQAAEVHEEEARDGSHERGLYPRFSGAVKRAVDDAVGRRLRSSSQRRDMRSGAGHGVKRRLARRRARARRGRTWALHGLEVGALLTVLSRWGRPGRAFHDMVVLDDFALFVSVVICYAAAMVILLSIDYLRRSGAESGEYYALVLFATTGMMLLAAAGDLVVLFLSPEASSRLKSPART
jgi:hypothetical protein